MRSALKAALFYFACVFAIGFALGVVRVLVLAPWMGELPAVCIEIPLLLTAAWHLCRRAIRRFDVGPVPAQRIVVCALAFGLLLAAEFCLATFAFGRSPANYFADLQTLPGMLGLAAQVLFGLFPLLQLERRTVQ